jgi:outer membrane protein assembly factor BamE
MMPATSAALILANDMRKLLIPGVFLASLTLAGCGSPDRIPFAHRIDVQQGNVIAQEQVDQLKPGMSKRQVRFTLGTPMIADVFNQDRWDYVYRMEPGKGEIEQHSITLFFVDDALTNIEGDFRPNPQPELAATSKPSTTVVVPPQPRKAPGILTRIWNWMGFGKEDI